MNNIVREIVYEDDKVIAYADYDLAGRIYSDKEVDLYITHKKEIESLESNKLNN